MFKKVMYILFAALLGAIIFLITAYCSINEAHLKQCKKAAKNDDYAYFLKFSNYYMEDPVYEYESENYKLFIYATFMENTIDTAKSRLGYAIIVDDVNTEAINITNQAETKSTITFSNGDKNTSWDFDLQYTDFFGLTFYELTTLELNRDLGGVIDDKGSDDTTDDEILTAISSIDAIKITDGAGTTFFQTDSSFKIELNEFSEDDFRELGLPGYTPEESSNIYFPSSVYTIIIVVMIVYLVIVASVALFIFRKKTVIEDNTPFSPSSSKEDILIESAKGDYSKIKSVYKSDDSSSKNEVIDTIVEEKKDVSQVSEETEEIETIIDTTKSNIAASSKETVRIKVKKPSESVTIVKDRSSNPNEVIKKATEASKAAGGSTSKKRASTTKKDSPKK